MPRQPATSGGRSASTLSVLGAGALVLGCVVLAGATSFLATVAHQYAVDGPRGTRWPVGLALAVGLTACVALFLRALQLSVGARIGAVAGWLVMTALTFSGGAGEDVLVPANVRGYVWLLAGVSVLVAALAIPGRVARPTRG